MKCLQKVLIDAENESGHRAQMSRWPRMIEWLSSDVGASLVDCFRRQAAGVP
jgi:hypothetical protein